VRLQNLELEPDLDRTVVIQAHERSTRSEPRDAVGRGTNDRGTELLQLVPHVLPPQSVTIPSGSYCCQRPRVKSGKRTGALPMATERSEISETALKDTES